MMPPESQKSWLVSGNQDFPLMLFMEIVVCPVATGISGFVSFRAKKGWNWQAKAVTSHV